MSIVGSHESAIKLSAVALRGRDRCWQIRDRINALRQLGIEPIAVWINAHTRDDMKQLWYEVQGGAKHGAQFWDGVLPKWIAGVPCREGSTGGHDFVIEWHDDEAAHQAREVSRFRVADDPHGGVH